MKKQSFTETGKWARLIGNGPVKIGDITAFDRAGPLYCADGGANLALAQGLFPDAVFGDGDSIGDEARAVLGDRLFQIDDEDTTDFEKCLANISDQKLMCFGFLGGRLDHQLAALSTLTKFPATRAVLVGDDDVALLAVSGLRISLPVGSSVALYPLAPCTLVSRGLVWETGGIAFDPLGMLATSNKMALDQLTLDDVCGAMILILPRAALPAVQEAIDLWSRNQEH